MSSKVVEAAQIRLADNRADPPGRM